MVDKVLKMSVDKFVSIYQNQEGAVEKAVRSLRLGHVIALPTDTLYGLACDAANPKAVDRLFHIKHRDENKPVAICVGKIDDVHKWGNTDNLPISLLDSLLPGPVTLILPCRGKLNKLLTYRGKVGIRIPDSNFIRKVALGLRNPLALTSANVSSKPSALTVDDFSELWDMLPVIFDGGQVNKTREGSTIIDLSNDGCYRTIRSGIAEEEVCVVLKKFGLVCDDQFVER